MALPIVEELKALARSHKDSSAFLIAQATEANMQCFMGDLKRARHAGDQLLRVYDFEKHGHLVHIYNHDPKCVTLVWAGFWLWALGYPDQARQGALDGLKLARHLNHAFQLCWCLTAGSQAFVLRGETRLARQWIAEGHALAHEHAMTFIANIVVPFWDGYALISQGDYAEGYERLASGMRASRHGGGVSLIQFAKTMRAKALKGLDQFDEARDLLDAAVELIGHIDHRMHEAEVHRTLGELHQQQATPDADLAETSFLKALDVARYQEAKGFELRAATNLARLWQRQGKRAKARRLLGEIYNWFTEGFDTVDLQEAKALLNKLS